MHGPKLSDYDLVQADVERAKAAELRQEIRQQKLLPWLALLGPVIVGYQIYSAEPKLSLAVLLGFFVGGAAGLIAYFAAVALWMVIWAQTHRRERAVLNRYKQYQTAANEFARDQQRTLERFWTGLSGKEFEQELANLFRRIGHKVELTSYGKDGGVDIVLRQGARSTIVQCKRYSSPVGVAVVRELYGVLQSIKADSAILAATGGFTQGVKDFAKNKPIELLGLKQIIELQKTAGTSIES